jgi:hypothetical protein
MRSLFQKASISLVCFAIASGVLAQNGKRGTVSDVLAEGVRPVLTGKERLGPKWTDEQRIDNCHVPMEKRGDKPRPSTCPNRPSS